MTTIAPQPAYRTRLPRWPWLTIVGALFGVLGFTIGAVAFSADAQQFVPAVQDAYPETEGRASDVLGYGYAVCAGLDDGRTEADMGRWLSGVPYQSLGVDGDAAEFATTVVDLAAATLCEREG